MQKSTLVIGARIVGVIMIITAIYSLVLGFYFFVKTNRFIKTAVRTQGKVVDNKRSDSDGDVYRPVFSFVDDSGKKYIVKSTFGSYPPKYEIGESVSVLYDPYNPQHAKIDSFEILWLTSILPFILSVPPLIFGPLFIFVTPIIITHIYRHFEKKKKEQAFH